MSGATFNRAGQIADFAMLDGRQLINEKKQARDILFAMHAKRKPGPQTRAIHAGAWALELQIIQMERDLTAAYAP